MRRTHVLGTVLQDAVVALRGQRVASVVSTLVVAGTTAAILATTGQTVASERRVLSEINSPAARLVVLADDEGRARVDATSVRALGALEGVEWAFGLGPAVDVGNAAVPDGPTVAARELYGSWPAPLSMAAYRSHAAGDALVGPVAAERLGLLNLAGGVTGGRLDSPVVGGFTASEPLTHLDSSVLVPAEPSPGTEVRTVMLSVQNVEDLDAVTRAARAVLVAEDPSRLSVRTSAEFAALQDVIGSQLAETSRRLLWVVLGAGMVLVTATQFGAVSQRARDYGRRRALGATRTGILVHVLVQVGLCAVAGAGLGCAVGLLLDWRVAGALPGLPFTAAVATLSVLAPLLAAVPPALRAAYRDPVRILRIP